MSRVILVIVPILGLTFATAYGCSSSSSSTGPSTPLDGGTDVGSSDEDSAATDSSFVNDSSVSDSNADHDAAASDEGGMPADTGSPTGDSSTADSGGTCVALTSVPDSKVPGYNAVAQQIGACNAGQISAFLAACTGSTQSKAACDSFRTSGANAGCMGCLVPETVVGDASQPTNNGGVLLDYTLTTVIGTNVPGCIALADATNGPSCAAALEPLLQCGFQACSSAACQAASAMEQHACFSSAETGACSVEYGNATVCAMDLADGGTGATECGTDTQTLNAICGTGP